MAARSFSVYVDVEQAPVNSAPTTSTTSDAATDGLVVSANKENLNPITGERVPHKGEAKKRKTSVLAMKASASTDSDVQPLSKKRKGSSSSSSSSTMTLRTKPKRDGSRKVSKKTRKGSPMPKVEEEEEAQGENVQTRSQAAIDSRCYELTVSPLADVSDAYLQTIDLQENDDKTTFVRDASAEPQIRDYFSPKPDSPPSRRTLSSRDRSQEPKVFNTPERKQIYAAFTFSTPSPTKDRIQAAQRCISVPPLTIK
ncbi:hypothetical protein C8J56DRAFT_815487 [Mycena floridula]|nr:hypothetical protein C8J56DRAFT_815487 [Mycena floridula]